MNSYTLDGIEYRFFDHLYAVSKCGKLLRRLSPVFPIKRPDGYLEAGRHRLVHRMVAMCWLEKPDLANYVHHKNHDRADNRAENLEWLTAKKHLIERHADHTLNLGKYERTQAHREKLRQLRTGTTQSAETRAKISASGKGKKHKPFERALHTQEWKDHMSLTHHRNASCEIFGIVYRSFAEASRATGIHRFTLRKRCLSDNFPDYKIIQNS